MSNLLTEMPFETAAGAGAAHNVASLMGWSNCSGAYCAAMCAGGCGLICFLSVAGVVIAAAVSLVEGNAGNNLVTD